MHSPKETNNIILPVLINKMAKTTHGLDIFDHFTLPEGMENRFNMIILAKTEFINVNTLPRKSERSRHSPLTKFPTERFNLRKKIQTSK